VLLLLQVGEGGEVEELDGIQVEAGLINNSTTIASSKLQYRLVPIFRICIHFHSFFADPEHLQ